MNRPNYQRHIEEDARLIILRELIAQLNGSLNETILEATLDAFGHTKSREWVRTQMRKLEELGGVTINQVGTVLVATITRAGRDHVQLRSAIEGVKLPSPGG